MRWAQMKDDLNFAKFHVEGIPDDRLSMIKTPEIRIAAKTFRTNLGRLWNQSWTFDFFVREGIVSGWTTAAAYAEVLGKIFPSPHEMAANIEQISDCRRRIKSQLGFSYVIPAYATRSLLEYFDEVSTTSRLEGIITSCVISAWTVFEVLAGDLWEASINLHPMELAQLSGKLRRKKKEVGESRSGAKEEFESNPKQINLDMLERYHYTVHDKMGTILKGKFNFNVIEGIQEADSAAWGDELINRILENRDLQLLHAVRNLLVHKSGVVDRTFKERVGRDNRFSGVQEGQPVRIDGMLASQLIQASSDCSCKLLTCVDKWLLDHTS
jgi:hypothetical protein